MLNTRELNILKQCHLDFLKIKVLQDKLILALRAVCKVPLGTHSSDGHQKPVCMDIRLDSGTSLPSGSLMEYLNQKTVVYT